MCGCGYGCVGVGVGVCGSYISFLSCCMHGGGKSPHGLRSEPCWRFVCVCVCLCVFVCVRLFVCIVVWCVYVF